MAKGRARKKPEEPQPQPHPPLPPRRERGVMSVSPPFEVAGAIGGYRTTQLNQAVRLAAQLLGDAAVEVAGKFSPQEWALLGSVYVDRIVDPELPDPGRLLARLLERSQQRYRVAEETLGLTAAKADEAVAALVGRLEGLSYVGAWAVVVACQVRQALAKTGDLTAESRWWDLAWRQKHIRAAQEAPRHGGEVGFVSDCPLPRVVRGE